ncbi:CooT family nickel-binding protein [Candidatus Bathyarchaeota archaeon]|jgi:predicted RNA-binding protein|nr:CooT family nickel-binding protein [Candidatus Bathyarchaeota archaeon]MCK4399344.1 CooT family nickel-binding protein [Candidatus Bathyarchaeota archaeon]
MCEFKVFLGDERVAEDVIYAKVEGHGVTLRDVLGKPVVVEGVRIVEVDVSSTRLVLEKTG